MSRCIFLNPQICSTKKKFLRHTVREKKKKNFRYCWCYKSRHWERRSLSGQENKIASLNSASLQQYKWSHLLFFVIPSVRFWSYKLYWLHWEEEPYDHALETKCWRQFTIHFASLAHRPLDNVATYQRTSNDLTVFLIKITPLFPYSSSVFLGGLKQRRLLRLCYRVKVWNRSQQNCTHVGNCLHVAKSSCWTWYRHIRSK